MNKQMLAIIAIVAVVVVGVLVFRIVAPVPITPPPEAATTVKTVKEATLPPEKKVMTYTLADVSPHSKAEDCWIVIEGNVYDMTPYIQKQLHPGGAAILFGCGKDATAVFNMRPKDKTAHSQNARNILKDYFLGALAK
jgi:cytochrome b involved in lipid metabolism